MSYMNYTASALYPIKPFDDIASPIGGNSQVADRYKQRYMVKNAPSELSSSVNVHSHIASNEDEIVYLTVEQKRAFNMALLDSSDIVSDGFLIVE
tara:strand:- start:197 stop:481 length:285 start_codon:yes stop_codon:yes gene_type:complete